MNLLTVKKFFYQFPKKYFKITFKVKVLSLAIFSRRKNSKI